MLDLVALAFLFLVLRRSQTSPVNVFALYTFDPIQWIPRKEAFEVNKKYSVTREPADKYWSIAGC